MDDSGVSSGWRADLFGPPPARTIEADDSLAADAALRLVAEGTGIAWRGDWHNARQLVDALGRRLEARERRNAARADPALPAAFHRWRLAEARRARQLGAILVPVEPGWSVPLRRAPDLRTAAEQAFGELDAPGLVPLRALLGAVGAFEWRRRGIELPALGPNDDGEIARIHPHYGVFAPVRHEYLDLLVAAPLPAASARAPVFDIGTGTGVIAALLARRGIGRIIATDNSDRALACAADNLGRLGLADRIELLAADGYPPGRAGLVVCNPPWLPGKATTLLEQGVYDPDSRMLSGFLEGLAAHLEPGGEGWLLMSNLAERLGLRAEGELEGRIAAAGLRVLGRDEIRPRHRRSRDPGDPLAGARGAEIVSLWRLAPAEG
ncbi:MAG: class I SAM-dependent methyltransferase [Burkholderiaceae bacterium]